MQIVPSRHLGESLFTSTRIKESKILFENAHFERLERGIEDYYLGRDLEESEIKHLRESVRKQARELSSEELRLRITVSSKERRELLPKDFAFSDLQIHVEAGKLQSIGGELKCKSSPSPFSAHYPGIKMGSYMPLLRLKLLSIREGFDDCALLDRGGNLLELTTSNLFFYKGNRVFTPRNTILDGVIKKTICDLYEVESLDITPGSAGEFDGAFCANSVWIARPIQSIDQTNFKKSDQRFVNDMIKKLLKRGYDE